MKEIHELEDRTLWDITSNEGALTQFMLGIFLLTLSVVYLIISIWVWVKFNVIRRRWK